MALALALAAGGCGAEAGVPPDTPAVAGADRIELRDNAFDPAVVEVPAGTTITWAFTDGARRHNVVGGGFESAVASGGTFEHTFTTPGTYDYSCTLHAGMDGRVLVTDA